MDDLLVALRDAEQRIVSYDVLPSEGESGVAVLHGSVPILISAPHSVRHWRQDHWKQEEEYTAAFGYLLHLATGAHLIYGQCVLNPDPHDDNDCGPYKRRLDELFQTNRIKLVLDLHGARGDRDFAIAIGTIFGETFGAFEMALNSTLEQHGFVDDPASSLDRLVCNPPRYTGGVRQPTITRYAWRKHHISAAQIELSAWVRIVDRLPSASNARNGSAPQFRGDGLRIRRAFQALECFVEKVKHG